MLPAARAPCVAASEPYAHAPVHRNPRIAAECRWGEEHRCVRISALRTRNSMASSLFACVCRKMLPPSGYADRRALTFGRNPSQLLVCWNYDAAMPKNMYWYAASTTEIRPLLRNIKHQQRTRLARPPIYLYRKVVLDDVCKDGWARWPRHVGAPPQLRVALL